MYQKMDPKVKALWLEALRSGVYQQAIGALCNPGQDDEDAGYCCLGVLCDVTGNGYFDPHILYSKNYGLPTGSGTQVVLTLPQELREEFGIEKAADGELVRLNDEQRLTFAQIADWIEANL